MKRKTFLALLLCVAFCLLAVGGTVAFAEPDASRAAGTPLYAQDFENYDGTTAADSYAWNSVGMICDAPEKSVVSGADAIDGWSFKTGGTGSLHSNSLLAFRNNTLPLSEAGAYTISFDLKISNASSVGFEALVPNVNTWIGGFEYDTADSSFTDDNIGNATASYNDTSGVYSFSFDLTTRGGENWGYFKATFGEGGGYIVVDNIRVTKSADPAVADSVYFQSFSGYKSGSVRPWLYFDQKGDLKMASDPLSNEDANNAAVTVVDSASDPTAITGKSLKVSLPAGGPYTVLKAIGGTMIAGSGNWTAEFDLRLSECTKFEFSVLNTSGNISFDPSNSSAAESSSMQYSVTEKGNGLFHVLVDAVTDGAAEAQFYATFGSAGYIVIDNIAVRPSKLDYSSIPIPMFKDDFENYNGTDGIPAYLWNNTHLWSDRTENIEISDGFDGKALKVGPLAAGTYSGANLFGLKGKGTIVPVAGQTYEHRFEFTSENVTKFELKLQYDDPDLGDTDIAKISIDPINETFEADVAAEVIFGDTVKVRIQYKAPNGDIFGAFYLTAAENGRLVFDNYALDKISRFNIAAVLYGSDFENVEFGNFSIETNYHKEEQLLARITADTDKVINGSYSVLAGFDATNITVDSDKWAKLIELKSPFASGEKYAVTFRFRQLAAPESFFYVQLGGMTGSFVRFTESGITEKNSGVSEAEIATESGVKVFTAVMTSPSDNNSLLIGTYGGGYIVIDDLYISVGEIAVPLPEIEKSEPTGEKVFSEGFENQNTGNSLEARSYTSGVDVFGTKYAYGEMNGKIALVVYSGNDWSETLSTKSGVLLPETVYTLKFRYKKLSGENANVNLIVRGDTEKYIAFSTDGKVRAFTTVGGGFYKDIAVASVTAAGELYEASVTFLAPSGSPILRLGMYGVAEIAIDDVTLYKGGKAEFDGVAAPIAAPDKNVLIGKIRNARAVNSAKYTTASYAALSQAITGATAVYNDLDATQEEVTGAETLLTEKTAALVLRGDKTELNALIAQAKAIDTTLYTQESLSLLNTALASAETTAGDEDAVQGDVDDAVDALSAAIEGLVEKSEISPVDKTRLNALITQAGAVDKTQYTAATVAVLGTALQNAESVAANRGATQEEVDTAAEMLDDAIKGLVEKTETPDPETPSKIELNDFIALADAVNRDDYTAESVAVMEAALDNAKEVAADENATQAEIDDAASTLGLALDGLVAKDADPDTTDKTRLNALLDEARGLDGEDYTIASFDALLAVIEDAEVVAEDESATQEEIDAAANALDKAIKALVEYKEPTRPSNGGCGGCGNAAASVLGLMIAAAFALAVKRR